MFHLQKRGEKTQFAFTYPYSYNKCQQDLLKTEISSLNQTNVYFHKELLIKSKEGRNIDLITISSYDKIRQEKNVYDNNLVFPERDFYSRALKFAPEKKIIFISARVHPGETPSSHCMKGIIKFLMNQYNLLYNLLTISETTSDPRSS